MNGKDNDEAQVVVWSNFDLLWGESEALLIVRDELLVGVTGQNGEQRIGTYGSGDLRIYVRRGGWCEFCQKSSFRDLPAIDS